MAKKKVARTEEASEVEMERMCNFAAAFDDATAERMDEFATSLGIRQGRRCSLIAMTRDADKLSEFSISSPDAYSAMLDSVIGFREHIEGVLEIATAAELRLKVADCRVLAGAEA